MVRTFVLCVLTAAAGCSFGDDRPLEGNPDSGPGMDSNTGTDGPPKETGHLLISEIKSVGPIGTSAEFIEIWNPTTKAVDLSKYYLADFGDYWKLPTVTPPALAASETDFLVQFPANASLAPGAVLTVATNAAEFQTRYAKAATYAVDIAAGGQAFRDRRIGAGVSQLTNGGEVVILFYWDGVSDLVQDVDIAFAGKIDDSTPGNRLTSKGSVDGPDAGILASDYRTDAGLVGNGMSAVATDTTSYKRRALEKGNETQASAGNGLFGDDETSEVLSVTWDNASTAPTPGDAPVITP